MLQFCEHGQAIQNCLQCGQSVSIRPFPREDLIRDVPSQPQLKKVVWWAMNHMFKTVRAAEKLGSTKVAQTTSNMIAVSLSLQFVNGYKHDCVSVALDSESGRVTTTSNKGDMFSLTQEALKENDKRVGMPLSYRKVKSRSLKELNQKICDDLGLDECRVHSELQLYELGYLSGTVSLGVERLCCLSCAAQLIAVGKTDAFSGSHGDFFDGAPIIPSIYENPELLRRLIGPGAYGYISQWEAPSRSEFIQAICRPITCGVEPDDVWRYNGLKRSTEVRFKPKVRRDRNNNGGDLMSDSEEDMDGMSGD